jgi:hypothetical protein
VDTELERTDEVIQSPGWEQKSDGGWIYVAGESLVSLASKKRVKHIAQLLGIDFETALEYCDSLEV